jgi:hypothetical protein
MNGGLRRVFTCEVRRKRCVYEENIRKDAVLLNV